ncbi:hypothetical protein [Planococcus beigongshangi]|uniref:hypothetical protein n=1 Tax=Planococcus beigongshangi TaxID=2782536 RepID=UPI00193BF880|nr:hypothetical protein [Planococcus beigongshangi]
MTKFPSNILELLADADQAGVNMASPKAVVTHLLAHGEKENILFFYKPNSVEFDFDKYNEAVELMKKQKN